MKINIIIPVYNEENTIIEILKNDIKNNHYSSIVKSDTNNELATNIKPKKIQKLKIVSKYKGSI